MTYNVGSNLGLLKQSGIKLKVFLQTYGKRDRLIEFSPREDYWTVDMSIID